MSGGSHDYICYRLNELCGDSMHDAEMNDLIRDLVEVLHDLEWWESGDIGEAGYRETVSKFKEKWFKKSREERMKGYIDKHIENMRHELYYLIGLKEGEADVL